MTHSSCTVGLKKEIDSSYYNVSQKCVISCAGGHNFGYNQDRSIKNSEIETYGNETAIGRKVAEIASAPVEASYNEKYVGALI